MPCRLEHGERAADIGVEGVEWLLQALEDDRLARQMEDDLRLGPAHHAGHETPIPHVALDMAQPPVECEALPERG